jgi:aspartyl-tRNA(Asn)/glutamyl-tRNA(Gln) amidotransferase subunit A
LRVALGNLSKYGIRGDRKKHFAPATGLEDGIAGLRVAFSMKSHGMPADAEVAALAASAARVFAELGAVVQEIDPQIGDAYEIFRTHWWAGARQVVRGMPQDKRPPS